MINILLANITGLESVQYEHLGTNQQCTNYVHIKCLDVPGLYVYTLLTNYHYTPLTNHNDSSKDVLQFL